MRSSSRKIQKVLGSVQAGLGNLYEAQKRSVIAQLFGEKYSRQLTAVSVQDFVLLLPDSAVLSIESATDFRQLLGTARNMTTRLADERSQLGQVGLGVAQSLVNKTEKLMLVEEGGQELGFLETA